jgi:hypothetical protein
VTFRSRRQCGREIVSSNRRQLAHGDSATLEDAKREAEAPLRRVVVVSKRCRHPDCQFAGVKSCRCFGRRVARPPSYVVWATPTHPSRSWATELPGCSGRLAAEEG